MNEACVVCVLLSKREWRLLGVHDQVATHHDVVITSETDIRHGSKEGGGGEHNGKQRFESAFKGSAHALEHGGNSGRITRRRC